MAFLDFVTRVIITLLAMVYPGYHSYKAVKAADLNQQQAWLKYWLVLSVLSAIVLILEPFLYDRVPLWNVWKIGAVVFLVNPKTLGYEKIYQMVLQPQLDKHEAAIDATADRLLKAGQEQVKNARPQMEKVIQQGRDLAQKTFNKKET